MKRYWDSLSAMSDIPPPDDAPRPESCPRCSGRLDFYLRTLPEKEGEPVHRIYHCKACDHFEWVAEPAGGRS